MKQLDRLLFEQGGDCFFCKRPLAKADASVEHLLAQANGGTSAEENVVACCKAVNALFGNKPLKEKLAIILRQKQGFQCPARAATAESSISQLPKGSPAGILPNTALQTIVPAKSKAVVVGKGPISSAGILSLASPPAAVKMAAKASAPVRCPTCHRQVPAVVGQIDYVCPHCHGAFRY